MPSPIPLTEPWCLELEKYIPQTAALSFEPGPGHRNLVLFRDHDPASHIRCESAETRASLFLARVVRERQKLPRSCPGISRLLGLKHEVQWRHCDLT